MTAIAASSSTRDFFAVAAVALPVDYAAAKAGAVVAGCIGWGAAGSAIGSSSQRKLTAARNAKTSNNRRVTLNNNDGGWNGARRRYDGATMVFRRSSARIRMSFAGSIRVVPETYSRAVACVLDIRKRVRCNDAVDSVNSNAPATDWTQLSAALIGRSIHWGCRWASVTHFRSYFVVSSPTLSVPSYSPEISISSLGDDNL